MTHPLRVAKCLSEIGVQETEVLVAAILHDLLEDTATTGQEIVDRFGEQVATLVEEVTRYPGVSRRDFTERLASCSAHAILIRLMDRLDNLRDAEGLPSNFLPFYAQEALQMVQHALTNPSVASLDASCSQAFHVIAAQLLQAAEEFLPKYRHDMEVPRLHAQMRRHRVKLPKLVEGSPREAPHTSN